MKQIEINYLTSTGYEALYPQTSSDLVTYNSQTLTQVINQQNSDITGLQGQVGDSEVGVTIPKVKEYHFGAGSVSTSFTDSQAILTSSILFPLKTWSVYFIFNGLSGNNCRYLYLIKEDGANRLYLFNNIQGTFPAKTPVITNKFIEVDGLDYAAPLFSLAVLWYDGRGEQYNLESYRGIFYCNLSGDQYYMPSNYYLSTQQGTLSYSSLDIRIYYYD